MEPEPSIVSLLKAIQALTTQVGSLQDQVKSQGKQIIQLVALCRETNNLVGDKDQGGFQAKTGPATGPTTPLPTQGEKPTLQAWPKMDLPDPYKGNTRGRKATQWLDQMMLWVALHCNQFDKEEQMVVWILYHMTNKAANWALPIIGAIIKGKGNPPTTIQALMAKFKEAFADPNAKWAVARKIAALSQSTTTSKYITEFRNLMAELDWNEEAYIAQFTQGLHWKVKELLSTKDSIPDKLKAIFAAAIKIDNIRCKNEENRPKKATAKTPAAVATTSTTTTQWSAYWKTPTTSHQRKGTAAAHQGCALNAVKRGMGSSNVPTAGRPQ
ncbi:hypothetical protein RHS01_04258 [Rhizoctonia solani]|uniref:Retrotransposon gag domain-containing protein n=1 Tax=Rhizoctonia solani TaxID=456999 RepID=A0A8H7M7U8_9AGAM|nr:hypothetical protein RHS01_04258 [Rhizoctonia solani]